MFLSCVPRGTFPNSTGLRRHRSSVVRVVAGVFPGNSSSPPPCRWPQSSFSNPCSGPSRTPAIHGHRPKRNGLLNLGHHPSFRLLLALLIAPCLFSMLSDSRAQDSESTSVNRKEVTAEFSYLRLGAIPTVYQITGMTFFAHSSATSNAAIVDKGTPAERGYGFPDNGVTVVLPREARSVTIRLCLSDSEVTAETLSSAGTSLSRQMAQSLNTCDDLAIEADRISIVRFTGGSGQASIVRLTAVSGQPPAVFAGADRSVDAGSLVVLAGMAWDPDGSIASYAWTQITEEATDDSTDDMADDSTDEMTEDAEDDTTVLLRGADSPMARVQRPRRVGGRDPYLPPHGYG